jgi:hypothetical protein
LSMTCLVMRQVGQECALPSQLNEKISSMRNY